MEHWIAVGQDIWWFIRWPLVCGAWSWAVYDAREHYDNGYGVAFLAFIVTIIVANN